MHKKIIFVLLFVVFLSQLVHAQELHQDLQGVWRARVTEIISQREEIVPGTDTKTILQIIKAEILEGEKRGVIITIENDYLQLKKGDIFFLNYLITVDGKEIYSVSEPDRRMSLYLLVCIFIAVILIFGGWQGLRSLMSLAAGFFIILYLLLPTILKGISPLFASISFSVLIVAIAMYVTHGFKRRTHAAFLGTVSAIILTGIFAYFAVDLARLSGFSSEESLYLNLNTRGTLDFAELLLGAIIIGVLGILDDITITQASVVEEIKRVDSRLSRKEIYTRALRVGREHVGALVNTLILAYTGASLPLLLLFSNTQANFSMTLNREIFATELVRAIVGSTGLILAVPIATLFAVFFLVPKSQDS